MAKRIKKSTEQYRLELEEVNLVNNTNIKLKEGVELNNLYTKIIHICSCGKEWLVKPNNILSGNSKKCRLCLTFAECGIAKLGINFLEEYWDYKKNYGIDPWKISCNSEIYVFYLTIRSPARDLLDSRGGRPGAAGRDCDGRRSPREAGAARRPVAAAGAPGKYAGWPLLAGARCIPNGILTS